MRLKIEFYKHNLGDEEKKNVLECLNGIFLTTGDYVKDFEVKFAEYLGLKYSVGLTSCTAALHLALLALDIGSGDEVIMKTKWGSCNAAAGRIWLNLELAKKPVQCMEYIVVHELTHLLERHHDERFTALMDAHLPQWRQTQEALKVAPLGHEDWGY